MRSKNLIIISSISMKNIDLADFENGWSLMIMTSFKEMILLMNLMRDLISFMRD
jgi:hypothetical protein